MPTYEYVCKECGEHLDVQQSFTDDPLSECPACHGPLRKVFGNIAITFKGSGFYKTDSRASNGNGKKKADAAASGSSDSTTSSSDSSSSESKTSDTKKPETKKSDSASATPAAAAS